MSIRRLRVRSPSPSFGRIIKPNAGFVHTFGRSEIVQPLFLTPLEPVGIERVKSPILFFCRRPRIQLRQIGTIRSPRNRISFIQLPVDSLRPSIRFSGVISGVQDSQRNRNRMPKLFFRDALVRRHCYNCGLTEGQAEDPSMGCDSGTSR